MKKQLSFLLFISACACLYAQSNVFFTATVQQDPLRMAHNNPPPIFNWTEDYSVSYIKEDGKNLFCLIAHSDFFNTYSPGSIPAPSCSVYHATMSLPEIIQYININDIYIVDDYAFFCGSICDTFQNNYAMYGWFDLNGFFADSLEIHIDTFTAGTTSAPATLERLVAYKFESNYKVVAYGYTDNFKYKVVEIDNAINPLPTCDVANITHFLPGNTQPDIHLSDIFLTETSVVIIGHDVSSYVGYCVGLRPSVVPGICSSGANIVCAASEANGPAKGVALQKGYFVISYVYAGAINPYYTRIRVINPSTTTNIYSYEFQKPEKEDPIKMVYLSDINSVELLQPVYDSANFILLEKLLKGTNLTATMLTPFGGLKYQNLENIGGCCFMSFHKDNYYIQNRHAVVPHSNVQCPANTNIYLTVINNIPLYNSETNEQKNNVVNKISPIPAYIDKVTLTPECFSHQNVTR